jgi:hypothetical protein
MTHPHIPGNLKLQICSSSLVAAWISIYPVQNNQQMLKGVVNCVLYSSNYPDMFRQLTAILRGLHVPRKLLQVCPAHRVDVSYGWLGVAAGHTKRTITHIHPRSRQNRSSLQGTYNPWKSGFGGLVISMLASVTHVRGFKPGRSRPIFRAKKSSACLAWEGK